MESPERSEMLDIERLFRKHVYGFLPMCPWASYSVIELMFGHTIANTCSQPTLTPEIGDSS